mmetsp:Transcript_22075/g.63683  ORF Transcript_22075/g.63683 Transcript_22075/m.63683 type:complete len:339 (+) Transcript_22075:58-1074(+)
MSNKRKQGPAGFKLAGSSAMHVVQTWGRPPSATQAQVHAWRRWSGGTGRKPCGLPEGLGHLPVALQPRQNGALGALAGLPPPAIRATPHTQAAGLVAPLLVHEDLEAALQQPVEARAWPARIRRCELHADAPRHLPHLDWRPQARPTHRRACAAGPPAVVEVGPAAHPRESTPGLRHGQPPQLRADERQHDLVPVVLAPRVVASNGELLDVNPTAQGEGKGHSGGARGRHALRRSVGRSRADRLYATDKHCPQARRRLADRCRQLGNHGGWLHGVTKHHTDYSDVQWCISRTTFTTRDSETILQLFHRRGGRRRAAKNHGIGSAHHITFRLARAAQIS